MAQNSIKPATIKPDPDALPLGTQEAQYQLAIRLVDYMRLGEAIRILEALGDYKNSPALLKTAREIKAYTDSEETKLREEARRSRERREATTRRADRIWHILIQAVAAVVALGVFILVYKG